MAREKSTALAHCHQLHVFVFSYLCKRNCVVNSKCKHDIFGAGTGQFTILALNSTWIFSGVGLFGGHNRLLNNVETGAAQVKVCHSANNIWRLARQAALLDTLFHLGGFSLMQLWMLLTPIFHQIFAKPCLQILLIIPFSFAPAMQR